MRINASDTWTLAEKWVASDFLGQKQLIQIALPPRYTPFSKFPVLIVLDGDDYRKLGRMTTLLDQHFHTHKEAQWITVFVPCSLSERDRLYHPNSPQQANFQRFLVQELTPYLDDNYSTAMMGALRGLLGCSLSASCALETAFQYPNTFQIVCAQSAYMPTDQITRLMHLSASKAVLPLQVYLSVGMDETAYQMRSGETFNFLRAAYDFQAQLSSHLLEVSFQEHGGGHTWGGWQSDLASVLQYLSEHWQN